MLFAILGTLIIFLFLIVSEFAWRHKLIKSELSRKWIHIVVGSFVAVWPFFTDRFYVVLLALAFIVVICLSKQLKLFKSIHSVNRLTVGELLFPVAILFCALYVKSDWLFLVAVLHMGLADGLAALIGNHYGKRNIYFVFGQRKSVLGSLTFLATSILLVEGFLLFGVTELEPGTWRYVLVVPLLALATENLSPYGTDNLTVPAVVLLTLGQV